ncbi:MAG: glycosyltransferase family 39 protein [Deltaproteobacteria bacterium]|nr:glycosyltransferase family 39 protein [Deltaproteobacteria bacterium]MBI3390753.1 glycosyltransferase family 39 protein [Deltaproteobacteria bacterium]
MTLSIEGSANCLALPPPAWRLLLSLAVLKLALHVASTVMIGYGYSADELYFLDCSNRLAWGYVDHPPFSIAALGAVRAVLGDSLLALRFTAALAGATAIVLAGLMSRELGGGRAAQGLAGLAVLVSPVVLFTTGYYSMNAIDLAVWTLAAYLLLRLLNGADPRLWLALGVVLGVGLLNKWSVIWLGMGVAVGLILTPQRRWLLTPWPWLCGLVAALVSMPNLLWQAQHHWPTLEFMRTGMGDVMAQKPPLAFMREQIRAMHPVLALLSGAGLVQYFGSPAGRPYCLLAWIWITVFLLLMSSGAARPYYLAPAYPIVFAAGALAVERLARRRRWRWLPAATAALIVVAGAFSAPFALPVLRPERFLAYERTLGMSRLQTEFDEGAMPPQFGFQFGWYELTDAVAQAYARLSPDEQMRAGILTETFGEAGAINFFGSHTGLPHAIGTHNNYWLWGPEPYSGEVMLAVSSSADRLSEWFGVVTPVQAIDCEYCMPVVRRKTVYVCRAPRRPLREIWPQLKNYS